MSLKETLTGLTQRLRAACTKFGLDYRGDDLEAEVNVVASILEGVTMMLPNEDAPKPPVAHPMFPQQGYSKEFSHQAMYDKALQEARKARQASQIESYDTRLIMCADGPEAGVCAPIHPEMNVGNYTSVGGHRYSLGNDGLLHHCPLMPVSVSVPTDVKGQ